MVRAKKSTKRIHRKKRLMKEAKGFTAGRSKLYRTAKEAMLKKKYHSFAGRRQKKRDFRRLWIVRINAAARTCGLSYSRLIAGLKKAEIVIDRKLLAVLAVTDKAAFTKLAEQAKAAG